jgi:hypothetical protein
MKPANTTFRRPEGMVPNPKLRLKEQLHEVMRFKQFSLRTETAYWNWIRQFILFHGKRHPREMGKTEIEAFLSHLTTAKNVAVATQNQALNALIFLQCLGRAEILLSETTSEKNLPVTMDVMGS